MSFAIDPNMAANQAAAQDIQARRRSVESLADSGMSDEERSARTREACEGFEAVFIQKMWEQMRATLPKDGFLKSKEEEFWQGMYDQELGKSMASSGGIGLADMMMEQLDRNKRDINSASQSSAYRRPMLQVSPAPLLAQESPDTLKMAAAPGSDSATPAAPLDPAATPLAQPAASKAASGAAPEVPGASGSPATSFGMGIYDGEAVQPDAPGLEEVFPEEALNPTAAPAPAPAPAPASVAAPLANPAAPAAVSAVSQTLDELAELARAQQEAVIQAQPRNNRGTRESTASPINVSLKFQQMTGQAPYRPEAAQHVPPVADRVDEAEAQAASAAQASQNSQNPADEGQAQPVVTRITYQTNLPPNQRRASPFQNGKAQQLLQEAMNAANVTVAATREPLSTAASPARAEDKAQAVSPQAAPVAAQASAPSAAAQVSPAVAEMAQAQTAQPDILAGIAPRFVPTRLKGILSDDGQISAPQSLADNAAERPFQAGGPVLRGPEPVSGEVPLGNAAPAKGSMTAPVGGEISSGFGWRLDPFTGKRAWHTGVDIKAQPGEAVRAAMDGVVTFAGPHPELGNLIVVDHGDNLTTYYGHNQTLNVQAGQKIETGMELANAGSSGRAAGPHVHFEVRRGELALNPEPLLRQAQSQLTAAR